MEVLKSCSSCLGEFPLENFLYRKRRGYYESRCKPCHRKKINAYNKSRSSLTAKIKYDLHNFSEENFIRLLEVQSNRCAICQTHFSFVRAVIDHDHNCCSGSHSCGNCIRGILCISCNSAIGMLKDDLEVVKSAVRYLRKGTVSSQKYSLGSIKVVKLPYSM